MDELTGRVIREVHETEDEYYLELGRWYKGEPPPQCHVDDDGYLWMEVPKSTLRGQIGNVQGGWQEQVKFKDKQGNWRTRKTWGSGKAGW